MPSYLVTGASRGLGYAFVRHLAAIPGNTVIGMVRNKDVTLARLEKDGITNISIVQADITDRDALTTAYEEVKTLTKGSLDILINNAGRGIMTQQFADTNGIDEHMAANHFGHVVLTSHLLPLLKKTADAGSKVRIVNLSSSLHTNCPEETAFKDIDELQKDYGPEAQYGRSKLAVLLHAKYLARHLTSEHPNILANAVHPGIVESAQTTQHIHEPYPLLGYGMSVGLKPFRKSQFEGCVSSMYAATACMESGLYSESP